MIVLTLPYPVSANRYWRTYMPKGFKAPVTALSSEAKDYKAAVKRVARIAGVVAPIAGRVAVTVRLYPHRPLDFAKRMRTDGALWDDSVMCLDLDNALKVLIDSIKDVVIADDKFVRRIVADRMEPDGEARVELSIEECAAVEPQLGLALPCVEKFGNSTKAPEWLDPWKVSA